MERQRLGALGEKLAADHLKKRGYRLVERNYRCREGEVDIVARQGDCMVFVEVRTKTSDAFGTPEESITTAKRGRMIKAALLYLGSHNSLPEDWRIDVVAVELDSKGKPTRIEIIENAVEG
ncbi:MAG: YraN family protein [Chloroflexi bacterium]|nr:YraN family protein [Chloroflexota bacterium]